MGECAAVSINYYFCKSNCEPDISYYIRIMNITIILLLYYYYIMNSTRLTKVEIYIIKVIYRYKPTHSRYIRDDVVENARNKL